MSNKNNDAADTPDSEGEEPKQVCLRCGAILDSTSLGKTCPACLMQVGFESKARDETIDSETTPTNADEAALNEEDAMEVVQALFPSLEILELIGRGGMGIVYKARQTHLGRLVALKLLRAKCSGDPSLGERFTREARALAKLSHPNIVGVHDFGQAGDRPFLIMEYVDGVNLRSMLENKTLNPVEAMAMVPAICEALQFAHDEGVVHRDIKPENILVDRRGRVRIADFGLARLMSRSKEEWTLTGTRQVMGTPHYMAPEQIEHPQDVDHRADIYSLGVVIYEMLTGELPIGRFELPSHKINVDIRFDDIVLRTLEKEPTRRYQHVTEVQTAVEKIASETKAASPLLNVSRIVTPDMATLGVAIAAVIDTFVAIFYIGESFSPRWNADSFIFGTYHAIVACILGMGTWHLINHGTENWRKAARLLSVIPIHFGALAGLPIGILSFIAKKASVESILEKRAFVFGPQAQSLKQGSMNALANAIRLGKRVASQIVAVWQVTWRKIVRGFLLTLLWFAFCSLLSLGVFWFYGRPHLPTTLRISDSSAKNIVLSTSDEIGLRIDGDTVQFRTGYRIQPEDLRRNQLQFSLYLANPRPDLATRNHYGDQSLKKVYLSEAFVVHLTPTNNLEYETTVPYNIHGTIAGPSVFRSKAAHETEKASGTYNTTSSAPSPVQSYTWSRLDRLDRLDPRSRQRPSSIFRIDLRDRQHLPKLRDPTPIVKWLETSGLSEEKAQETADGIFGLLTELADTGGIVPDEAGEARLIPIADMLDKKKFDPQVSERLSITLTAEEWAIETWITITGIAAVLGWLVYLFMRRARVQRPQPRT